MMNEANILTLEAWLRDQIEALEKKEQVALRGRTSLGVRLAAVYVKQATVCREELASLRRGAA